VTSCNGLVPVGKWQLTETTLTVTHVDGTNAIWDQGSAVPGYSSSDNGLTVAVCLHVLAIQLEGLSTWQGEMAVATPCGSLYRLDDC
jgi:hypothetical protein